jgi:hypothetical protein
MIFNDFNYLLNNNFFMLGRNNSGYQLIYINHQVIPNLLFFLVYLIFLYSRHVWMSLNPRRSLYMKTTF